MNFLNDLIPNFFYEAISRMIPGGAMIWLFLRQTSGSIRWDKPFMEGAVLVTLAWVLGLLLDVVANQVFLSKIGPEPDCEQRKEIQQSAWWFDKLLLEHAPCEEKPSIFLIQTPWRRSILMSLAEATMFRGLFFIALSEILIELFFMIGDTLCFSGHGCCEHLIGVRLGGQWCFYQICIWVLIASGCRKAWTFLKKKGLGEWDDAIKNKWLRDLSKPSEG